MPTKRKSRKSQTNQTDLYQQVTDKIVASIEHGVLPWRKPWRDSKKTAESLIPSNASTGLHYHGVNIMLLWLSSEDQGFNSNHRLTWKLALATVATFAKARKRLSRCSSNRLSLKPPINLANRALMLKVRR